MAKELKKSTEAFNGKNEQEIINELSTSLEGIIISNYQQNATKLAHFSPKEMKDFQSLLQYQYPEVLNSLEKKVGQFKSVTPISSDVAIASLLSAKALTARQMLTDEYQLLKMLAENGFPVIHTYGEIFDIAPGKPVMLVDWIPDALLWDSKDPSAQALVLASNILGMNLPSGEGFALHLDMIKQNISAKLENGELDMVVTQAKVEKLGREFGELIQIMNDTNIRIGDLQLLIDKTGKITIIDPLAVLKLSKESNAKFSKMEDMLYKDKENHPDFVSSIISIDKQLMSSFKFCVNLSRSQDIQEVIRFIFSSIGIPEQIELPIKKPLLLSQRSVGPIRENGQSRFPLAAISNETPIVDKRLARLKSMRRGFVE